MHPADTFFNVIAFKRYAFVWATWVAKGALPWACAPRRSCTGIWERLWRAPKLDSGCSWSPVSADTAWWSTTAESTCCLKAKTDPWTRTSVLCTSCSVSSSLMRYISKNGSDLLKRSCRDSRKSKTVEHWLLMTAWDGLKLAVYSQKYRKAKINKVISAFMVIFELMRWFVCRAIEVRSNRLSTEIHGLCQDRGNCLCG